MTILPETIAPLNADGDALAALDQFLIARDYDCQARSDIKTYVRQTGYLTGTVPSLLRPEDLDEAEASYVVALWRSAGRRLPSNQPGPSLLPPLPGGMNPVPWSEFTAELLSLYHISMRAQATRKAMIQAVASLTALGVTSTADLTTGLIGRWVEAQNQTLSPNTMKARLRYICRLCTYAFEQGYTSISVFKVAPLRTWVRGTPIGPRKFHSREEISRVLAEMKRQVDTSEGWIRWRAHRLYTLTCTIACLGLRANEAYRLYAADVDLSNRVLHLVARSKRLKTANSQATLPLPPWLVPRLEDWARHRMDHPTGFSIDPDCPWFFPATRRRACWSSGAPGCKPLDRMKAVALSVGVPGFTPLSLRHSAATNLTALGAGPNLVRLLLRHTNNQTQSWYVHSSLHILREGIERVAF
jgi:integrase